MTHNFPPLILLFHQVFIDLISLFKKISIVVQLWKIISKIVLLAQRETTPEILIISLPLHDMLAPNLIDILQQVRLLGENNQNQQSK